MRRKKLNLQPKHVLANYVWVKLDGVVVSKLRRKTVILTGAATGVLLDGHPVSLKSGDWIYEVVDP